MTRPANPARGEASLAVGGVAFLLRPSFAALVGAEEELGPLLPLVERAASGRLRLAETAALFWHCLADRPLGLSQQTVGEALAEMGLARTAPVLKVLLAQILRGQV